MKIPIGNTNNIGEQREREAQRQRGSMKNNSIIVIGMEERKEVPCLHESAHGRSTDDRSLHRDRGGKLALLSSWSGSSASESPISVERAFV